MGNKPVRVRQRELETVIRGARNQGAKSIELRIGKEASVVIPLVDGDQKPIVGNDQIGPDVGDTNEWLTGNDTHQA